MAEKGWTARVAAAAGASAGIGAAQLGLGYGLGVVVWPVAYMPDDNVWLGSLGWATWITASATVFGAVVASRLGGGPATRTRGPWRLALATSGAAGALVAVALVALPARSAVLADTFSPQVIAGGYAMVGLVIGLVVAYWAVVSRPVATNLITTAVWLWALAISAIVVELTMHRSSATYLTSWQFAEPGTDHRYGTIFWPSAALTLAAAFLIGAFAVIPAARRGHLGVGAATSGAVGPLLVAAAFFVLAPRLTGALGPLESAYLIAPYAVLAGLAGSALTVAVAQAAVNRQARKAERNTAREAEPALATATGVATVPAAEVSETEPSEPPSRSRSSSPRSPSQPSPQSQQPPSPQPSQSPSPQPSQSPSPQPSPSPKGRARFFGRSKPAPAAPGDQGDPAGPATSVGSSAVPKPSASPPGSTSPAAPASADQAKPWDMAPGTKPQQSTLPAPGAAKPPTATPSGSSAARPASDQSPTGTNLPTSDQSPTGTAESGGNPSQPGAARPGTSQSGASQPGSEASRPPQPGSRSAQAGATDKSPGTPAGSGSARTGTSGAQSSGAGPAPGDDPANGDFDSEIAAAARPRGRAKKATPLRKSPEAVPDKAPKSTVTPPPTTPTIAQINPKPPKAD